MRGFKLLLTALSVASSIHQLYGFGFNNNMYYRVRSSSSAALNLYKKTKWSPSGGAHVSPTQWSPHHGAGEPIYTPGDAGGVAQSSYTTPSPSSSSSSYTTVSPSQQEGGGGEPITMNLQIADALSNSIISTVLRNNFAPIVVTILDTRGTVLVQKSMDNCIGPAFHDFSYAKAYTCVALNVSSREFRDKYTIDNDPGKIVQCNSMMAISGKMAAFPGGVLLRNGENQVIGAIGVSGAAGDEDEYAALKGVWDSGLAISTWPLEHSCTTAQD